MAISKKSDKQKKGTGFNSPSPNLHLSGRCFFFLAWRDPQKDPFLHPAPLCSKKKVMGAGSGTWSQYPLLPITSPICPSRKEAGLCQRVGGLTLTSDLGLECQPMRFQNRSPFPRARSAQSCSLRLRQGPKRPPPCSGMLGGDAARNKGCDLHAVWRPGLRTSPYQKYWRWAAPIGKGHRLALPLLGHDPSSQVKGSALILILLLAWAGQGSR